MRYVLELGTMDVKAYHGCREVGEKERGNCMQSINQERRASVDRCKRTESRKDKLTTETKMPFSTPPISAIPE